MTISNDITTEQSTDKLRVQAHITYNNICHKITEYSLLINASRL